MRAYLIDEISASDVEKMRGFLEKHAAPSNLDRLYWVPIPDDLLTATQRAHPGCKPHVFSVELGPDWIKFECYVRSLKKMRCSCPGYPSEAQMNYIVAFAHRMIEQLGIST
jgi:hypothetical protein